MSQLYWRWLMGYGQLAIGQGKMEWSWRGHLKVATKVVEYDSI